MSKIGFQEAFQTWLRKIILDSDIETEGLYSTWADKDSEFPYIVYKLESNNYQPDKIMTESTLTIDIWDYSQLERNVLEIREQLVELLDGRLVRLDDYETYFLQVFQTYQEGDIICQAARIDLQSENVIPTDTDNIWRRELQFSVRYDRKRDISNILDREQAQPIWDLS